MHPRKPTFEQLEPRALLTALVAAYSFDDEGSGAAVADASAYGNDGVMTLASRTAGGKYGGALWFNGWGSIVEVPDSPSLRLVGSMTLMAWVNPHDTSPAWRDVIYKGHNDDYFLGGTSPFFDSAPGFGGTFAPDPLYGSSALPLHTWSHLAATYDGTTMRLYVNGIEIANKPRSEPIVISDAQLSIGGDRTYHQHWLGLIDEVRVYNTALTPAQIQSDMNRPIGSVGVPDTTAPSISITSPSGASTVSGTTPITVAASDNVGVVGVEFFVDGVSQGELTEGVFQMNWNTTALANGTRVLTAVARDAAGNFTTSAPVTVTTANPQFVNETIVPGILAATTMAFLPDGRMLVGELTNTVWVVQPGANINDQTPFLQLDYSQAFGEQGLMDIAIDPDFENNGYFYVFYTKNYPSQQNRDRLSRFTADGNGTLPGSEFVLWEDDVVANAEHHGGAIALGTDGKIYFTVGDHFDFPSSQNLSNYHGKVLRINFDGTIPTDNPFYDGAGPNKDQIWAYGLRNPYRMSIDPLTGRMYIGDVGGNDHNVALEELNLGVAGANYGWPLEEGPGGTPGVTPPIYSYEHFGRDASITGGIVYRGSQFPSEYYGSYFFGDYVQNTIKRITFDAAGNITGVFDFWPADGAVDTPGVGDPVKFVEGPDGSIYYVDIGFNDQHQPNPATIRRIRFTDGNLPPVALSDSDTSSGLPPLTVGFSSFGSHDPEGAAITYLWDFGDGNTSTEAFPLHTYQNDGHYIVQLTVSDGSSTTLAEPLGISVGTPPVPTIIGPADGMLFRAGDVIDYSGSATDTEDGTLPLSAFSWQILFHHDTHAHPGGGPFNGSTSGTLTIPTAGHDFQGNTRYEIVLTVTDSSGLSASTSVIVWPEKVNLGFDTLSAGLELVVDGQVKQGPFVIDQVIGFEHTISAPDQVVGGTSYVFVGWSDGGARTHQIIAPTTDQTYTAIFQVGPLGDLNDDGWVDAADIDLLWAIIRDETGTFEDPGNDDVEDFDGSGAVDVADLDYMLANLINTQAHGAVVSRYGDADLDGGVGGLDFTAWRQRAGTGWAHGDFDGDGGVGGLDFTLWRERPTTYNGTVTSGSGTVVSSVSTIPLSSGLDSLNELRLGAQQLAASPEGRPSRPSTLRSTVADQILAATESYRPRDLARLRPVAGPSVDFYFESAELKAGSS